MAIIELDSGVIKAIGEELFRMNAPCTVRIELTSTGCCDATLVMREDAAVESDLVEEVEGLTFVMCREIHDLVGCVRITCRENAQFSITSDKPVNEWGGFGSCSIRA